MGSVTTERRVLGCVDLIADLLTEPLDRFPVAQVSEHLREAVDASFVAWNYVSEDGRRVGYMSEQAERFREAGEAWLNSPGEFRHPLLLWYATSGSGRPLTSARVPSGVADRRCQQAYTSLMRTFAGERQLSVPVALGAEPDDAIVLCRSGDDFTDADLELATRVQPLLTGVRRQIEACSRWADSHRQPEVLLEGDVGSARQAVEALGVTPRELSVLQLLCEGRTQGAIAHQLGISPRTVQKHLEHLYAKLGVGDRLLAVLRARDLAILPQPRPPS